MASEPSDSSSPFPDLPSRQADVRALAHEVLAEDGAVDLTSALVPSVGSTAGHIRTREDCTAACLDYATAVAAEAGCRTAWTVGEGAVVRADEALGSVTGEASAILRAERPILNVLQRACGIATATRRFVEAVAGTPCRVLHTRKTAPRLRLFDVAAVIAGGGHVHRLGLDRIVMIKDNHWAALAAQGGDLGAMVREALARGATAVQIEVESEEQVRAACQAGADRLLIDNQSPAAFRQLAALARDCAPGIEIEATGGITLDNVRAYADAGADFVSIGALTHSVRSVDLTLET